MKSTFERRLIALEQITGRAPTVVRIRDGETAASARERHDREYPQTRGRPLMVAPLPCATAEEWQALYAPGAA